ncbi:hypothetical protein [Nitrospira sp. Nam74]
MTTFSVDEQQQQMMKTHPGVIAALDQSGGSAPARDVCTERQFAAHRSAHQPIGHTQDTGQDTAGASD